jgi:hypothetical protein
MMERPGWISIVGILGIVLGCFGLMGAGQMAMLPNMVKMQKQMIADMQVQMKPEQRAQMEPFEHLMDGFWGELPPWYMSWAVTSGLILMAIKGFYIFAALSLLQLKRTAVRQFYWAAGLSIAAALVNAAVMVEAFSGLGVAMAMGSMIGVVLNLVLLAVVIGGDKAVFGIARPPPL